MLSGIRKKLNSLNKGHASKSRYLHFTCVLFAAIIFVVTLYSSVRYTGFLHNAKAITELQEDIHNNVKEGKPVEEIPDLAIINTGLNSCRRPGRDTIDSITVMTMNPANYSRNFVSVNPNIYAGKNKKGAYNIAGAFSARDPKEFFDSINNYTDLDVRYYFAVDVRTIIRLVDQVIFLRLTVKPEEVPLINENQKKIAEKLGIRNITELQTPQAPAVMLLNGLQAAAYANLGSIKGTNSSKGYYFRKFVRAAIRGFKMCSNQDIVNAREIMFSGARYMRRSFAVNFMARARAFRSGASVKWPAVSEFHRYKGWSFAFPKTVKSNAKALNAALAVQPYAPSKDVIKRHKEVKKVLAEIEEEKRRKAEEKRRAEEAARRAAEQAAEEERQRQLQEQMEQQNSQNNESSRNSNSNDNSGDSKSDKNKKPSTDNKDSDGKNDNKQDSGSNNEGGNSESGSGGGNSGEGGNSGGNGSGSGNEPSGGDIIKPDEGSHSTDKKSGSEAED